MKAPLTIRIARPQDARALAAIYRPYVEQTAISFECEAPTATAMLRRMEDVLTRYPYLVAERGGDLLGYAYAHPFAQAYSNPCTHRHSDAYGNTPSGQGGAAQDRG